MIFSTLKTLTGIVEDVVSVPVELAEEATEELEDVLDTINDELE